MQERVRDERKDAIEAILVQVIDAVRVDRREEDNAVAQCVVGCDHQTIWEPSLCDQLDGHIAELVGRDDYDTASRCDATLRDIRGKMQRALDLMEGSFDVAQARLMLIDTAVTIDGQLSATQKVNASGR